MLDKFIVKNKKGFTLIELLIVVAIIGILAAIAIPQFAAYRIRGYNSSAQSDVRNLTTSQAAFFADWQIYGVTDNAANAGPMVLTGPSDATDYLLSGTVQTVLRTLPIGVGNNVEVFADVDANSTSFLAFAKHVQGDTVFASDGDVPGLFFDQVAGTSGTNMGASAIPSTVGDDLSTITNDTLVGGGTFIIR